MTLVCVSIMVHDEAAALADVGIARDAGADLVEFRVDEFFTGDEPEAEIGAIVRLLAMSALPCVLTCRIAAEGGGYAGDEADRIALFERVANVAGRVVATVDGRPVNEHPPRYIDVEHAAFARSANIRQKVKLAVEHPEQLRDLATGLILSMHDFDGRPKDLNRRLMAMAEEPAAAVVKVAYRARSLRDSLEILELPEVLQRPTIAVGMGVFGLMSRILAPKFGGFLTFAGVRAASTTAPGQPTVRELMDLYRFRAIRPSTKVYGVVGWPLEHSLSPHVHNAGFEEVGYDGVYVPLPIAADEDVEGSYASFKGTMLELIEHPRLTFRGCSVTIPHKENLVRLARERRWTIEPAADAMGAGNTLAIGADGIRVMNTDAPALAMVLGRALGGLTGRRVAVLGAGGMARAAAYACLDAGASVAVVNRTVARAEALVAGFASRFGDRVRVVADASLEAFDAIVNCTSVGMVGGTAPDGSAVDVDAVAKRNAATLIMDTVYKPRRTALIERAEALGLRTLDGMGLFVAQASMQFEAWTGQEAPGEVFERVVERVTGAADGGTRG